MTDIFEDRITALENRRFKIQSEIIYQGPTASKITINLTKGLSSFEWVVFETGSGTGTPIDLSQRWFAVADLKYNPNASTNDNLYNDYYVCVHATSMNGVGWYFLNNTQIRLNRFDNTGSLYRIFGVKIV